MCQHTSPLCFISYSLTFTQQYASQALRLFPDSCTTSYATIRYGLKTSMYFTRGQSVNPLKYSYKLLRKRYFTTITLDFPSLMILQ